MSFEPFLALEASAGSGKTFALSLRFCALILKGANINEITALTFTKKAANEMKARIIKNFLNFEHLEAEAAYLAELLEEKGVRPSLEKLLALREAKRAQFLRSNLHIYTFDSFFVKIIRAFSLHLGLLPDFEMVEELDTTKDFIKSLSKSQLRALAVYLASTNKAKKDFFKDLELLNSSLLKQPLLSANFPDKELVLKAFEDFKSSVSSLSKNAHFLKNFNATTLEEIVKKPVVVDTQKKYFDELPLDFWSKREEFLKILDEYYNLLESFKLKNYLDFLKLYEKARLSQNIRENKLSFADATRYTYKLLSKDSIDKDLIYFRLDASISHLLIDEFQDTNIHQYEILKPIVAELVSGIGVKEGRSFFYVGDVKQSIYRFRGAKKELFAKLQEDFPQIQKASLDTNYRSKKAIVEFVNESFLPVMQNYKEQKSVKEGGLISVETLEEQARSKEGYLALFTPLILKNLKVLKDKNVSYEDICILCWTNKDATAIKDLLKASNIPAYTDSNLGLLEFTSPRLVYEYAKFLLFKDLFSARMLEEYLGKKPASFSLDLKDSPLNLVIFLANKLGLDMSDLNLIAYLEYATGFDDFLEFLFTPCSKEATQGKGLGVSVMTVHKSKGLEFPYLLILDKLSDKTKQENEIKVEYENEKFELRIQDSVRKHCDNQKYSSFFNRKKRLDEEDLLNQQYVAFTRAKEALFILKKAEKSVFWSLNLKDKCQGSLALLPAKPLQKAAKSQVKPINTSPFKNKGKEKSEVLHKYHFGLALHEYLENIDFKHPDFNLQDRACTNKYKAFLENTQLEDIFKRARVLLKNHEFTGLLKGKRLSKEQPLFYKGEKKVIDLLAMDEKEILVFDYKSWDKQEDEHEKQVGLYKEAISSICKKPTRAFIVYLQKKGVSLKEL